MVRKYLPLFELLVEASEDQRKAVLKTLSEPQMRAVIEAIYNVLGGVCPLNIKDKSTLYDYRTIIRRLVGKELTAKQRQRLLCKHRNILPLLLKPVLKRFRHEQGMR
jgi:hypothetical protein